MVLGVRVFFKVPNKFFLENSSEFLPIYLWRRLMAWVLDLKSKSLKEYPDREMLETSKAPIAKNEMDDALKQWLGSLPELSGPRMEGL